MMAMEAVQPRGRAARYVLLYASGLPNVTTGKTSVKPKNGLVAGLIGKNTQF